MSFIQTKIIQIVYFYHKYHESLLMTIRINITIMIYLNEFHCWIHFRLANRYGLIIWSLKLEHTGLCSKNHLQCTTYQWLLNGIWISLDNCVHYGFIDTTKYDYWFILFCYYFTNKKTITYTCIHTKTHLFTY